MPCMTFAAIASAASFINKPLPHTGSISDSPPPTAASRAMKAETSAWEKNAPASRAWPAPMVSSHVKRCSLRVCRFVPVFSHSIICSSMGRSPRRCPRCAKRFRVWFGFIIPSPPVRVHLPVLRTQLFLPPGRAVGRRRRGRRACRSPRPPSGGCGIRVAG